MHRAALLLALVPVVWSAPLAAREAVEASAPSALAVTLYRDPNRGTQEVMDRDLPRGFAMITEKRTVTLPSGQSTIRFTGVAEGMVAVSAIVTGLPGGTIEKNRNADLLSPAALVDGSLGNRVTVTRTNPATGEQKAEDAIVRTRADGGLVLQTGAGFEAVRCSGLPERLTFDRVPAGLSAQPVFSVDTRDPAGGTYTVELTYLAWGFDWQAHYVATIEEPGPRTKRDDEVMLRLMSWLTLLNDNGQSFPGAELLVVAGRLNVVSDFQGLADPPDARELALTCYPLGSTAAGSPVEDFKQLPMPPLPAPPPSGAIVVTGQRLARAEYNANSPMVSIDESSLAQEEALGDLKLYRVPEPVTVAAKSLKQVAFLDQDEVEGRLLYETACSPSDWQDEPSGADMLLLTVNDKAHGLGMALPTGAVTLFEPTSAGELLVGEQRLRDYAEGQDIEIELGRSAQVFAQCAAPGEPGSFAGGLLWVPLKLILTNANPNPAKVRLDLGQSGQWRYRRISGVTIKDGRAIVEVTVPGNSRREFTWEARSSNAPG